MYLPEHIELWRVVRAFPDYEVSDKGRVRSWKRSGGPREMRLQSRPDGYVQLSLRSTDGGRTVKAHRLVADAFIANPDQLPEVAHRNGDRGDNNVANLRWSTTSDNERDKSAHGTNCHLRGATNPNAVLRDSDIARIRELYGQGDYRQVELAALYGVSQVHISRIVRGEAWTTCTT